MAREHLERRGNWQAASSERGRKAEDVFQDCMENSLRGTDLVITKNPMDLKGIYGKTANDKSHGIKPEFCIRNPNTERRIYVEVKRQRAAGNAHERACKYAMPGILSSAREIANQPDGVIPFWWVFTNGIANDHRYCQEIMHWFKGIEGNVLLWRDMSDCTALTKHFDEHIRPLLQ